MSDALKFALNEDEMEDFQDYEDEEQTGMDSRLDDYEDGEDDDEDDEDESTVPPPAVVVATPVLVIAREAETVVDLEEVQAIPKKPVKQASASGKAPAVKVVAK